MSKRFVSLYTDNYCYGGPEEGGWYYTVVNFESFSKCTSKRKAKKLCSKINRDLEKQNKASQGYEYQYAVVERRHAIGKRDNSEGPIPTYC